MDWVLPFLSVGNQPGCNWETSWKALKENRISLVVDLNAHEEEERESRLNMISYYGIKCPDPPLYPEDLLPIFRRIDGRIVEELESLGEAARIYLHCSAGQRRSPTCAMAFLISEGYPVELAIDMVKKSHLSSWPDDPDLYPFKESLELWQLVSMKRSRSIDRFSVS